MLIVDDLSVRLGEFALDGVSFTVNAGDYFVLLGASGVGKTVLLEAIAGLVRCDAVAIRIEGRDVTSTSIQHRRLGLVFQDRALFPHLSVFDNIAYGLRAAGMNRGEIDDRVQELAAQTGLTELLGRKPSRLSGGEGQRVAIARALATEPVCLLLDEPLSALDTQARAELRSLLRSLHRAGQTIVHVTHDYEEALALATQIGILESGRIAQVGTPTEIFQHPKSEFVARFVGVRNFFAGELIGGQSGDLRAFDVNGLRMAITSDQPEGRGFLLLRSEDVTLSAEQPHSSARNTFQGTIKDIEPARLGVEVIVNIGVEMATLVTQASVAQLGLRPGVEIWVTFKATAGRFIPE